MKFLELESPHAFLVWRNKQSSIANNEALLIGEKLGLICDNEIYGEVILGEADKLSIDEFDKNISGHCIRDYERKLNWPDSKSLYVHPIEKFEPYDELLACSVNDGELIIEEKQELTDEQKEILKISENLPSKILIDKESVVLTDDKQFAGHNIKELLNAAFDGIKEYESESSSYLPLYQLALVRAPVLRFKQGDDMPFDKVTRGDEICVINTDTEEVQECYSGNDADDRADELLTALRINVEDEESKQSDENENVEDTDSKAGRRLRGRMLKRLRESFDTLKEIISWAEKEDEQLPMLDGFSGFGIKESKDGPIFYTYATNAFEDREGELFSTKALQNFVDENADNEIKGYFNLFHMLGTDFAEKRFQVVVGRMLLEAGPFLNSDVAKQIKKFLKKYPKSHPQLAPEGWGASIEYKYLPEQRMNGVYDWVWITKTSLLPRAMAANINTIGALKMDTKELNPAQIELGKEMLGADLFNKLVEEGEIKTAKLEEELNFKDNEEEEPVENPEEVEPEVEAETESAESVEEVETELAEEESVDEEPVETPDVEAIVKSVVGEMIQGLKTELEIIAVFPKAIEDLNSRIDELEKTFAIKQASEKTKFSFLDLAKEQSVTKSEGETLTDEEVKEKGPKETELENDGSYGAPFFNRS